MSDAGQSVRRGAVAGLLARGAVAGGPIARCSRNDGVPEELAGRLAYECQILRAKARTKKNFKRGHDFESMLCRVLRDFLPARVGICRGRVVDRNGVAADTDIIVYDAIRYRTLRGAPHAPDSEEEVQADAVLAVIEAKYTLYAQAKVRDSNRGQSLAKACSQIADVKRLVRAEVPLDVIASRFGLREGSFERRPGFPVIRNPLYGVIWALNLKTGELQKSDRAQAVSLRLQEIEDELVRSGLPRERLPDTIAAGDLLAVQTVVAPGGRRQVRPFIAPDTERQIFSGVSGLVIAAMQLRGAIEDIVLGEGPWGDWLDAQLAAAE
ncbi:DUF6602 domain-containing protein [Sorangium sp. So ce118]